MCIEGYFFDQYIQNKNLSIYDVYEDVDNAVYYCEQFQYNGGATMLDVFGHDNLINMSQTAAVNGLQLGQAVVNSPNGTAIAYQLTEAKEYPLRYCYWDTNMCNANQQCHNLAEDYVLTITTPATDYLGEVWMNSPQTELICRQCPNTEIGSPGVFDGSHNKYSGYSWGESSCSMPEDYIATDEIGTYYYSGGCMYSPSTDAITTEGEF